MRFSKPAFVNKILFVKKARSIYLLLFVLFLCFGALLYWDWARKIEDVLIQEKSHLTEERYVPFEIRPLPGTAELDATTFEPKTKILSALRHQDHWWLGTTNGIRLFDAEGNLRQGFSVSEGWPQGEVTAAAFHHQAPVLAVSGTGLLFPENTPRAVVPRDISFRSMTVLLSTPQGDLWIGTRSRGLLQWREDRLQRISGSFPTTAHVTQLAGSSTDLWVGTFEHGLWHYRDGYWKSWGRNEGLTDRHITALAIDSNKNLCAVGTPMGGVWLEQEKVLGRFLENEYISSLAFWRGSFTVSLRNGSALSLSPGTRPRQWHAVVDPSMPSPSISRETRFFPQQDELFLSTEGTLWSVKNPSEPSRDRVLTMDRPESPVLNDGHITSLAVDGGNRLWVGFFDSGLDILDLSNNSIRHWRDDILFCINSIFIDGQENRTLVSTANGLAIFSTPETYHCIRREGGLIHNSVSCARTFGSDTGTIYVATAGGLTLLEGNRSRSLFAFHGLPSNQLYAMASSAKGLYLGTLAGLSLLNFKEGPRNFSRSDSPLRYNWINALWYEGQTLWIGTYGGGVQILRGNERWETPCAECTGMHINPGALFSSRGMLFAGTQDDGFILFDPDRRTYTQIKSPLPSQNITAFAADDTGVFIGSDHGLVRFALNEVRSYLDEHGKPWTETLP